MRWVLEDLTTDQPVLLVVDDLQWADTASVESLDLLANAVQQLPCLVVFAVRSGEPVGASESLNRLLAASTVLNPGPLSRDAVAEQVRAVRPRAGDAEIDEMHRTSGGIPFFVNELLAAETGTPDTVVGSVAGRLSRLTQTATITARAVCVLGQQANVGMVAELTGHPLASVADDISTLVSAQILTPDGSHLRGTQPLIADAVLAPMTSHEASELHHKAAIVLMRRGTSKAVIADHLLNTLPGSDPADPGPAAGTRRAGPQHWLPRRGREGISPAPSPRGPSAPPRSTCCRPPRGHSPVSASSTRHSPCGNGRPSSPRTTRPGTGFAPRPVTR